MDERRGGADVSVLEDGDARLNTGQLNLGEKNTTSVIEIIYMYNMYYSIFID